MTTQIINDDMYFLGLDIYRQQKIEFSFFMYGSDSATGIAYEDQESYTCEVEFQEEIIKKMTCHCDEWKKNGVCRHCVSFLLLLQDRDIDISYLLNPHYQDCLFIKCDCLLENVQVKENMDWEELSVYLKEAIDLYSQNYQSSLLRKYIAYVFAKKINQNIHHFNAYLSYIKELYRENIPVYVDVFIELESLLNYSKELKNFYSNTCENWRKTPLAHHIMVYKGIDLTLDDLKEIQCEKSFYSSYKNVLIAYFKEEYEKCIQEILLCDDKYYLQSLLDLKRHIYSKYHSFEKSVSFLVDYYCYYLQFQDETLIQDIECEYPEKWKLHKSEVYDYMFQQKEKKMYKLCKDVEYLTEYYIRKFDCFYFYDYGDIILESDLETYLMIIYHHLSKEINSGYSLSMYRSYVQRFMTICEKGVDKKHVIAMLEYFIKLYPTRKAMIDFLTEMIEEVKR